MAPSALAAAAVLLLAPRAEALPVRNPETALVANDSATPLATVATHLLAATPLPSSWSAIANGQDCHPSSAWFGPVTIARKLVER